MFNIERWQEIFETLKKNKLRTILTGISVASGIFILVVLLGFSSGIQNGVTEQFSGDATNEISVRTRRTTKSYKGLNPNRRIQLKNEDFENVSSTYDDYLEFRSANYSIWSGQIVYKNETGNFSVQGVHPDFQYIENSSILQGRFINQADLNDARKVIVIGTKVKSEMFKGKNPIDEMVSIFGINFKVVGVYSDPGGEREEDNVYIPITAAQVAFNGGDRIRNMQFTVPMQKSLAKSVEVSNLLLESIERDLKQKYIIAPDDRAAIRVSNTLEEAQKIYSLIDIIKAVFWFVGIGTIIAGVVGVGNIMIIIVKERTKEIGIRKALGAVPMSIVGMILQEAIFVTMFSGLFGLILGLGLLELVGPTIDNDYIKYPQVDFNTALYTVFLLVAAGSLAGFVPAYRAAKIKPIIALRDE
ncbi:ABC transporter permease [Winogradskyella sp. DF17]|uniref:ABC transporter permease n=1 Tax=Winogradskyella pelagia TaxID=2819984 RepID=A0ABS3SYK8_9FLAO|nr:ABC transporter permease [Winogradskyella sp. DF17]MBO3115566.1 ABC transporter permease [Winogradskyella sp. DF17]